MNLRSLQTRLAALEARVPPTLAVAVSLEPTRPPEIARALVETLLSIGWRLLEAADGLDLPSSPWAWNGDQLAKLHRSGRLKPRLVNQFIALGKVLGGIGLLVVRRANGKLAPADVKAKRQAIAAGRPTYTLPYVAPLVCQGIDVKAELAAEARAGGDA